ncbi:MAG: hypothetical protein FD138_4092, partial [Planctomycetota bacterium]
MSRTDPYLLTESGHYRDALSALQEVARRRALLTDEQILNTELLSLTGAVDESLSLSDRLLAQRGLAVSQRCRLRDVLGTSWYRKGQHTKGVEHYRRGIELAENEGELVSECTLRVHLLRNQNHWVGPHQASVQLSSLRRKIYKAADPKLALQFQLALAELAAKLGLGGRARQHLNAARSLLPTVIDRGIHADVKLAEIAMSALESDVLGALQHAFELAPLSEETGSGSARFGSSTNVGHLLHLQARLEEALDWLRAGLREHSFGGGSELALRDTLMSVQMSRNLFDEAGNEAAAIERILDTNGTHD